MKIIYNQSFHHTFRQHYGKYLPKTIPMELLEPYRKQIEYDHCGQTLERLNERGGLSPGELYTPFMGLTKYLEENEIRGLVLLMDLMEDVSG